LFGSFSIDSKALLVWCSVAKDSKRNIVRLPIAYSEYSSRSRGRITWCRWV